MSDLVRRLRSPLVALVVLAISAGVVFAGGALPQAADDGLATATEASGKTVPVRAQAEEAEEPTEEAEEPTEEAEEPTEEAEEPTDEAGWANHGAMVSEAARMDTPEAFANHGAFVSCVARMKGDIPEDLDLAALTPEDCAGAEEETDAEDADEDADTEAEAKGKGKAPSERGKSADRRGGQHGRGGS